MTAFGFRLRRLEFEARKQNQIIEMLLTDFGRGTRDWLWETNAEGALTSFSPWLTKIVGRTEQQLLGCNIVDLFVQQDAIAFQAQMEHRVEIASCAIVSVCNGIESFWQISARPLFGQAGEFQGYSGVGRDVTSSRVAELQTQKAIETAETASLAKSNFLAAMSHELRTPINAIVGFCEILNTPQAELLSSERQKAYLNTIIENATHLQSMINDVLDMTRLERGSFQLVEQDNDAAEIIEAALQLCREKAEKSGISIVAHLIEDVCVHGDLVRLKQVVQNLLINAIKFSPAGSIVNIDMHCGPTHEFVLSIRDAGIGISSEDAERAFDSFVQLEEGSTRRFAGMGLGLSIAQRIARLHGGEIKLSGKTGIGTEAQLTLPASRLRWSPRNPKLKEQVAA